MNMLLEEALLTVSPLEQPARPAPSESDDHDLRLADSDDFEDDDAMDDEEDDDLDDDEDDDFLDDDEDDDFLDDDDDEDDLFDDEDDDEEM